MNSTKTINTVIKSIDQKAVAEQVQKMLSHFETNNFINIFDNKVIHFGFNTEKLKENIKNEWLLRNTVLCDQPTFQFKTLKTEKNFRTAFEKVKNLVNAVPFSFVEIEHLNIKEDSVEEFQENFMNKGNSLNSIDLVKNLFKTCHGTNLRNQTLCAPSEAVEFFYKQQRDRKIWWRKFSALPSRFHTTQISIDENNKSQFVEIQAEFPWGFETVECVKYFPNALPNDDNFFEMKSQRKKFIPQIVTCETILEKIALTYLCDSYEKINEETDRDMLRFNRVFAPYKVAFAGSGTSAEVVQNLKDLALLLAKKIRKCGISVLLLPDVCLTSTERQVLRNDAIGVPYTILLNEKTLKDGLIAIRSRDTTLKEQSHVSLVVPYIEKLINFSSH